MKNKIHGFSLLEMVVVLAILGLLIAGIVGPLATRFEQKQRQETLDQLDIIKDAIYGFVITNARLPCPDTDTTPDGIENPDGGAADCALVSGTVPYATLEINAITDAWGNAFFYQITDDFADTDDGGACLAAPPPPPVTVGVSFQLCSVGDMTINNPAGIEVVNQIPLIVYSGGKNDFSAGTAESENTDLDTDFTYSDYRMVSGSEYDDLMIWISPNILKYRMVQAGRLP